MLFQATELMEFAVRDVSLLFGKKKLKIHYTATLKKIVSNVLYSQYKL